MTLKAEQVPVVPLYAGFWRRGAAMLLDGIIMIIPTGIINVALKGSPLAASAVNIAVACAYYALFHSSAVQATPGKLAFGIKVTNLEGGRIGVGRGIARYFSVWVSLLLLGIGYLMAAFTGRKQALHDMIAGTLVVNRKADPEEVVAGGTTMPVTFGVVAMDVLLMIAPIGILAAIAIPAYSDYVLRSKIVEAINLGSALKEQVNEARVTSQPLKAGPADTSGTRYVRDASIAADGTVTVRLAPTIANGGSIVWKLATDATGRTAWQCFSDEVPNKYLPASCRR